MTTEKLRKDIVHSATGAKAHFDVWWAFVNRARPDCIDVLNRHSDYFRTAQDAHYKAFFIYTGHLYDKRSDASSINQYLKALKRTLENRQYQEYQAEHDVLAARAVPLVNVRHNAVAHVNKRLTESDIFEPLNITWNAVRRIIYDSADFVAKLCGAEHPGEIGMPRNDRLIEATLKLLYELEEKSV